MNLSRRGFLKLLSAVPAVAAVPALAETIEALPEVDEPITPIAPIASSWLSVNGIPAQARSFSMNSRARMIDATRLLDSAMSYPIGGIDDYELEAELCGPFGVFKTGDRAEIVAVLGGLKVSGRGSFGSIITNIKVGQPIIQRVQVLLSDVVCHQCEDAELKWSGKGI